MSHDDPVIKNTNILTANIIYNFLKKCSFSQNLAGIEFAYRRTNDGRLYDDFIYSHRVKFSAIMATFTCVLSVIATLIGLAC